MRAPWYPNPKPSYLSPETAEYIASLVADDATDAAAQKQRTAQRQQDAQLAYDTERTAWHTMARVRKYSYQTSPEITAALEAPVKWEIDVRVGTLMSGHHDLYEATKDRPDGFTHTVWSGEAPNYMAAVDIIAEHCATVLANLDTTGIVSHLKFNKQFLRRDGGIGASIPEQQDPNDSSPRERLKGEVRITLK